MAVYTYLGNLDPSERTTRLVLRAGGLVLQLGYSADITTDEHDELYTRYDLVLGQLGPLVTPSSIGVVLTDGEGHLIGPDGTVLLDTDVAVTVSSGTPSAGQAAIFTGAGYKVVPGSAGAGGSNGGGVPPYFGRYTVASRSNASDQTGAAVAIAGQTNRITHRVLANCGNISVAFGNFIHGDGTEDVSPITVQCAISPDNGTTWLPVTFNGSPSVVLAGGPAGPLITSDVLGIELTKGSYIKTDTFVVPTTDGQICPSGPATNNSGSFTDGFGSGNLIGHAYGEFTVAEEYVYAPLAVLAEFMYDDVPSIAVVGDSITDGQNESPPYPYIDIYGAALRAFNGDPAAPSGCPIAFQAVPGDGTGWSLNVEPQRRLMIDGCDVVYYAMGRNDMDQDAAVTIAQIQLAVDQVTARGKRINVATITPGPTSTDGWTTEVNQTPEADPGNTRRQTINAAIRAGFTGANGITSGLIELADALETARDSGICKVMNADNTERVTGSSVGYPTTSGIHPVGRGYDLMAQAVPLNLFKSPKGTQLPPYVPQDFTDTYTSAILATGGLAWFGKLDEVSGTTMVDSSGNGNDGAYTGGVTLGQPGQDGRTAALFDGTTGYASIPDISALISDPTEITWEAWVYVSSFGTANTLIADDGNPRLFLNASSGSGLVTMLFGSFYGNTNPLTVSAWNHVVFATSGGTGTVYVNGSPAGSTGSGAGSSTGTFLTLATQDTVSNFFAGKMQFAAVYSTRLDDATVAAHFAAMP